MTEICTYCKGWCYKPITYRYKNEQGIYYEAFTKWVPCNVCNGIGKLFVTSTTASKSK